MTNRLDATNCTHEAALARVAELESKLANAERDFQESYASAGKWQGLAVEYKSKLERASKFANANAEDVESLQGKVRELESLCSSQALRLQGGLERIERLRDWIQERADDECPYGEMDFESCGHNRKHGICSGHAASKALAQDTFVSDAPVVERRSTGIEEIDDAAKREWRAGLDGRPPE